MHHYFSRFKKEFKFENGRLKDMGVKKAGVFGALILLFLGLAFSGCLEPAKPVVKPLQNGGNHFNTGGVDTIAFAAPTPGNASTVAVRMIAANVSITAANFTNVSNATINIYYPNMTLLNSTVFIHDAGLKDNKTAWANFTVPLDGRYFVNATTYDTDSWQGNATLRVITVDTAAPTSALLASSTLPSGSYSSNLSVNITANDTNLYNCVLQMGFVNGTVGNYTVLSAARNNCFVSIAGLKDGLHNYSFFVNDSANQMTFNNTVNFIKIINVKPVFAFGTPGITNGSKFASYNFVVNMTIFSINVTNVTLYVTNATGAFIVNTSQFNLTQLAGINQSWIFSFPIPTMGEYWINATAYDAAGNVNSTPAKAVVGYSIFNYSVEVLKGSSWIDTLMNVSAKLSFNYCPAANGTVCAANGQQANFPVLRVNNQGSTNGTQIVLKINSNSTSEDLFCGPTGVFANATRVTDGNQTLNAYPLGPLNQTGLWCWAKAYNATRNIANLTVFAQ